MSLIACTFLLLHRLVIRNVPKSHFQTFDFENSKQVHNFYFSRMTLRVSQALKNLSVKSAWTSKCCRYLVRLFYCIVSYLAMCQNRILKLLILKILNRWIVSTVLECLCGCLKHKKISTMKVRGCQIVVDILYVSSSCIVS